MTDQHSIPLWHANGQLLPGNAPSRVVLSSVGTKWNDVVVEQHHFPSSELSGVAYKRHVITINIGGSITWELRKRGGFGASTGQEARFPSCRAISLFLVGSK